MEDYKLKNMEDREVLILGGMGAIGSNLAHSVLDLGAKVTIFDNLTENTGANLANINGIRDKIKFIKGDIRDLQELKKNIRDKHIIFNCAAQVSHVLSMKDPFLDINTNCKGNMNVLECCRRYNDSAKIIHAGSRSQFGQQKTLPINESCFDFPLDIFSANKLAAELYHRIYYRAYGLATTTLRLTNIYGPRAQTKNPGYSIVNWFIARAILNEDLTVFEPGRQLRDLSYMQDAVDALILASQNKLAEGEVFVVGSGKGVSLIDLSRLIVQIAKSGHVKLVPWSNERKAIEAGDIIMDYTKIKEKLSWYPRTSLQEGLKKTISFYRSRFDEYFK